MTDENPGDTQSVIEMNFGENHLRIEGTETFIENQLDTVFDRIDIETVASADTHPKPEIEKDQIEQDENESEASSSTTEGGEEEDSPLRLVAEEINVNHSRLREHFYVDEDGPGIRNPRDIEPQYALLGFCVIQKVLEGKSSFGNRAMKERLIEDEMVPIENWGSQFLYNLRRKGLLKNDPSSDKGRNKPFKLTPNGIAEFADWVNQSDIE